MKISRILLFAFSLTLISAVLLETGRSRRSSYAITNDALQASLSTYFHRGQERKYQIRDVWKGSTSDGLKAKAKHCFDQAAMIDSLLVRAIAAIEQRKEMILSASGKSFLTDRPYMGKEPLKPSTIVLHNLKDDKQTQLLNGDSDQSELMQSYVEFFENALSILAGSHVVYKSEMESIKRDERYYLSVADIRKIHGDESFQVNLNEVCGKENINPDDREFLKDCFRYFLKDVQYWGVFFQDSHSVSDAILKLSALEGDLLRLRANVLTQLSSRISYNVFPTQGLRAVAFGPEVVNMGDRFEVQVYPVSTMPDEFIEVFYNDEPMTVHRGRGIVTASADAGFMDLTGTVKVMDRSGIKHELPWRKSVAVMKPSGYIDLPEMNVLYRGHDNLVVPIASGFPATSLTIAGGSLEKKGFQYVVNPGKGRICKLTVVGKTIDGRSVALKSTEYRVGELPRADMYLAGKISGSRFNKEAWKLIPKSPSSSPIVTNYEVVSWKTKLDGKVYEGEGDDISVLKDKLGAIKTGDLLTFECKVKFESTGIIFNTICGWTL